MDDYEITLNPKAITERLLIATTAGTIASVSGGESTFTNMATVLVLYFALTGGLLALKIIYDLFEEDEESAKEGGDGRAEYDWTPHRAS